MNGVTYETLLSAVTTFLSHGKTAALFFDLDGTLVDTMPLHFISYRHVFGTLGGELTRTDFDALVGPPAHIAIRRFASACQITIQNDSEVRWIHEKKKAKLSELLTTTQIDLLPAGRLLLNLGSQYPVAVVTSGNTQGARAILSASGLLPHVKLLISGDDVHEGKPAPEPYLQALKALNVSAQEGIAFEDHANGIQSAVCAGLPVIDVLSGEIISGGIS